MAEGSYISTGAHAVHIGHKACPPLEVDAMENRLEVGAMDSHTSNIRSTLASHFDHTGSDEMEISVSGVVDFDSGIKSLSDGSLDILAIPAIETIGRAQEIGDLGCQIIGARVPRRPSEVLVSPDKLLYQPKSAIIVSDSDLVRRQILRARPDILAVSSEMIPDIDQDLQNPSNEMKLNWLSDLLQADKINGFVISRAEYDDSNQSERRHALLPFPKERGGPHFLPKPYADLVAILSRQGFPLTLSEKLTEPEGNTILWVQSRILGELNEYFHDKMGIQVRHRQVGSLLRQAEDYRDIILEQACHNPDGDIIEEEVRVEVRMELISEDGSRTIAMDRLVILSEYQYAVIGLLRDWNTLVKESSSTVPKDHPTDDEAPPFLSL